MLRRELLYTLSLITLSWGLLGCELKAADADGASVSATPSDDSSVQLTYGMLVDEPVFENGSDGTTTTDPADDGSTADSGDTSTDGGTDIGAGTDDGTATGDDPSTGGDTTVGGSDDPVDDGSYVDDDGQAWCPRTQPIEPSQYVDKPGKHTKALICHYPPGNPDARHTILIGLPAVNAHVKHHHDTLGRCDGDDDDMIYEPCDK